MDDPKTKVEEAAVDEGKGAYGTVHVMEEQMRAAEQGVFAPRSGDKRKRRGASETKMEAAPSNKSAKAGE